MPIVVLQIRARSTVRSDHTGVVITGLVTTGILTRNAHGAWIHSHVKSYGAAVDVGPADWMPVGIHSHNLLLTSNI